MDVLDAARIVLGNLTTLRTCVVTDDVLTHRVWHNDSVAACVTRPWRTLDFRASLVDERVHLPRPTVHC